METTLAQRIKELRTHYNLSVKEFAGKCGLSHVAIFHLESGKTTKPHRSSLQRMVSIFGTTSDWILFGKNEMLPAGSKEITIEENAYLEYWKDEAYLELKNKNVLLEKEVERLWQMIGHITSGEKTNFRQMLDVG